MNPPSDASRASPGNPPGETVHHAPGAPSNWREALMGLIASRVALIQLESKDAATSVARVMLFWGAALCCAVFAWALLAAGAVAAIAQAMHWPWHGVALAAGVLHLLAGTLLAILGKPAMGSAFAFTRAEFKKDREWIENLHKNKKSND